MIKFKEKKPSMIQVWVN